MPFDLGLRADHLEIVRGQKRLFSDLSFDLPPGRLLVVRGSNGSGKTSLIRALAGLAAPAGGAVVWRDAGNEPIDDARGRIAYVAHHPAVDPVFTARENLRSGLALHGKSVDDDSADRLFKRLGLPARLPAAKLSQGQQRRLALAQLSLAGRPAWLLDEPLTALDDTAVEWFRDTLASHLAAGGLCVMSLHQGFDWHSGPSEMLRLTRPRNSPSPATGAATAVPTGIAA
jgi:heme exporter protein A